MHAHQGKEHLCVTCDNIFCVSHFLFIDSSNRNSFVLRVAALVFFLFGTCKYLSKIQRISFHGFLCSINLKTAFSDGKSSSMHACVDEIRIFSSVHTNILIMKLQVNSRHSVNFAKPFDSLLRVLVLPRCVSVSFSRKKQSNKTYTQTRWQNSWKKIPHCNQIAEMISRGGSNIQSRLFREMKMKKKKLARAAVAAAEIAYRG